MVSRQLKELLLQSLEHERGGVLIYERALTCVINPDLKSEWQHYLEQTRHHVEVLTHVCAKLGLDPGERTPGCLIVHHNGKALLMAMQMARAEGDPEAAELVACDCVVLAETKDHANWELIGECAKGWEGKVSEVLTAAHDEIEDEEDEHLYHSQGWCRELWLKSLQLKAVLPPPEETKDVHSASEAEAARKKR